VDERNFVMAEKPILRSFRLHWLDGSTEDVETDSTTSREEACAAAMNQAGIGAGALAALDYWEELPHALRKQQLAGAVEPQ
jgi:hypothetical protein